MDIVDHGRPFSSDRGELLSRREHLRDCLDRGLPKHTRERQKTTHTSIKMTINASV